ncbi:MAG TPA: lysophospholipid acyltransferase family protein [Longimicrobiaceae bacterium]|nr:lysophospholipid acyltransferase family protein [Longimicrobiaceae bacterium]
MIRTGWAYLNAIFATLFFGAVAIVASLLRIHGRVYFWATQQWGRTVLWASDVPVYTHGMDGVDWEAPQVLVANHTSAYDILALAAVLPGPFAFVAKKELERIPFFGTAWKAAEHISIDRTDRQSAVQSLRRAGEKIRREHSTVIIFPEGTRSRTGELQPFKKGAFMLALEARVSVVPVLIRGSAAIMPAGSRQLHPQPIHLYFDTALHPDEFEGAEDLMTAVEGRMRAMVARTADD